MDAKWITCLYVGGYGHALTKGKVYEAVAEDIEQTLRYLDEQGEIEKATLLLK